MIGRRWNPWDPPVPGGEPDPEPDEQAEGWVEDHDTGLEPSEDDPEPPLEDPEPGPPPVDAIIYEPDGPLAIQRDDRGRILPGTTLSPPTMFGPKGSGVGMEPPRGNPLTKAERELRAAPFDGFEIDYALAHRLRESLAAPDSEAMDRLALLARRIVDDALRGRQHAQEILVERLQPKRPTPRAEEAGGGMVIQTLIIGPQGTEEPPSAFDFRDHDVVDT